MESTGDRIFGPVLDGFIIWVLKDALKKGKKRLYFLARDGYFMYRAAGVYVEKFSLPIECRYLSCSRYSLRLPSFHLDPEGAMEYICRDSIDVNLTRIMNRAGLNKEEQKSVLQEIGESGKETDPIPYVKLEKIREKLEQSSVFKEALLRHSKEAFPALQGYLRQNGLLDGTEDALVDSGWVGSMQKTLNELLWHMGRKNRLEGYYWGLYELPQGVRREDYNCYYFSPEGQLQEKVYFNNNLFETVFSAPHGMTIGYKEREGKYDPLYAPVSHKRICQMRTLESALLQYVERTAERRQDIESADCGSEKEQIRRLLKKFMGNLSPEEAEIYGEMYFCDDVLEYAGRPLAEVMSEDELRANHVVNKILVMTGFRRGEIKESAWYEGSAVRSSPDPAWHLFQYRIYKYLLYIRQMYMWRKNHVQKKRKKQRK